MRWFWIDRFLEFERGRRAVAVKNVSLAEEHLDQMTPAYPALPASLIVEGIAQTGGLLVGEVNDFRERVVLAKVNRARFHGLARPGDTLTYTAEIQDIRADGAMVSATVHRGAELLAEIELMFAHLGERFEGVDLFVPGDFICMLRVLGIYDVGRTPEGEPLTVPPHLAEAEAAVNA